MQSEIKKLLEDYDHSNFEPISFTSKKKNIGVVQFVLQTEKIELEEEEVEVEQLEEDKNLWYRFLDLFK